MYTVSTATYRLVGVWCYIAELCGGRKGVLMNWLGHLLCTKLWPRAIQLPLATALHTHMHQHPALSHTLAKWNLIWFLANKWSHWCKRWSKVDHVSQRDSLFMSLHFSIQTLLCALINCNSKTSSKRLAYTAYILSDPVDYTHLSCSDMRSLWSTSCFKAVVIISTEFCGKQVMCFIEVGGAVGGV